MSDYLNKLNNSQIKPVKDTEGAVLVIAGAGSGKTRVLTSRIAYLVNELGVSPSSILAITFTNKAANEMKDRLNLMIPNAEKMWVSTIHSMCVKILRSNIGAIGYNKNFSIYNEDDKARVLKRIINDCGYPVDTLLKICVNAISDAKNKDLSPREYKEDNPKMRYIGEITEVFTKYNEELKASNALDFDDLLIKVLRLFENSPETAEYYAQKFMYVHIDEFQDTNTVQYKICKALSSYHGNIFVVGDDDQSIYGWRGAKISNILDFEYDFKGAKVYKLEQNYRSTKNILAVANEIIKNNGIRKKKVLWTDNELGVKPTLHVAMDEEQEAVYVATKIKEQLLKGKKASDFAVLMRVNALSRSFEQEFLKYNIPYKVFGGFKFFDRKEIKDLTAYLRIITNPLDNEGILRVINVPRRGIGDKTVETIVNKANVEGTSVFDEIFDCDNLPLNNGAKSKIREFRNLIGSIMVESESLNISDTVKYIIDKTDFLSQFTENTEENNDKKMNVNEFVNATISFEKDNPNATIADFLSSITLSSDTDEMDESNYVTIATIHAVKGLEFNSVFFVGLDETIIPTSRAVDSVETLEEERRLVYVAVTRAMSNLYITRARSRYLYGNRSITEKSRFLNEMEKCLYIETPEFNRNSFSKFGGSYEGKMERNNYKIKDDYGYYPDEDTPSRSMGGSKFTSIYKSNNFNKQTPVKQTGAKYQPGMKVRHSKFGEGTVIVVRNEGASQKVDVAFKGVGIKTLMAHLAPMEIIK